LRLVIAKRRVANVDTSRRLFGDHRNVMANSAKHFVGDKIRDALLEVGPHDMGCRF